MTPLAVRVVDDPLGVPAGDQVHPGRSVGAHERRGVQVQPGGVERDRLHAAGVVLRPDDRLEAARGVPVEDDGAVAVLGADDAQRLGDLLVVNAQVAHVVRRRQVIQR